MVTPTFCRHEDPRTVSRGAGFPVCFDCGRPVRPKTVEETKPNGATMADDKAARKAEIDLINRKLKSAAALLDEVRDRVKRLDAA